MIERLRILYLGLPLGGCLLLQDGHDLVMSCISRPEFHGMRRLRRTLGARGRLVLGQPVLTDRDTLDVILSLKYDVLVSWFWTQKIPAELVAAVPLAFGIHPSLLPRHRGPDPYFWTLRNGDPRAGVTAHLIAPEYDTGAVIAQRSIDVPSSWDSWQLARALDRPSLALMRDILTRYSHGEHPVAVPQDDAQASLAPFPADDDCEIRWNTSVDDVLCLVRAASPEPGAFTQIDGETVVVLEATRASNPGTVLAPGEAARSHEGVIVKTPDGCVLIRTVRLETDESIVQGEALVDLFSSLSSIERAKS